MLVIAITVACVAFGVVAVAYGSFPEAVRRRSADAVLVGVLVPAAIATTLPVQPTGVALWDAALLAALVTVAGAAAAVVDRRVLLAVAAASATGAGLDGEGGLLAAGVALGTALAVAALGVRLPAPKAVAGACVALSLLGSRWPDSSGHRLASSAAILGLLAAAALVRTSPVARRRALAGAAGLVVVAGGAAAMAGWHALAARDELQRGRDLARTGIAAARDGRIEDATLAFTAAERDFVRARDRLDRWSAAPARLVPGLAQNHRAVRTLAGAGAELAAASVDVSTGVELDDLRLRRGALDLALVADARRGVAELAGLLDEAERDLTAADGPLLVPVVRNALDELSSELADAGGSTTLTVEALRVLPDLLGADRPRRWFVAMQAGSEYRATGGIIGSHAILTADRGRLTLGPVARTADLRAAELAGPADYVRRYRRYEPNLAWQNITLSPDGPSVGEVVEGLYAQTGDAPVDGVLLVDHVALAALLRLTGPIEVPAWDEPLTPENLSRVLLHEQYLRYPRRERVDFLGDAARGVFDRITGSDLPPAADIVDALADAVAGRHLVLHSGDEREQALFAAAGVDGALPPVEGDFLALVTQNASGNKIDWFLRRAVSYDARVSGDGDVEATLTVELRNDAPPSGLPDYVIGGSGPDPSADGANRMIFSVYSPLEVESATRDGAPLDVVTETELDRLVHEAFLTVAPGAATVIELRLRGEVDVRDGYRLAVRAQPTVVPDALEVRIDGESWAVPLDRDRRFSRGRGSG